MKLKMAKLRRDIFDMVNRSLEGIGLWLLRKARRSRRAPDQAITSRLSRITPLELINPEPGAACPSLQQEMEKAWENDWSTL